MRKDIPPFLLHTDTVFFSMKVRKTRLPFIDRTLKTAGNTIKTIFIQSEAASKNNLLYKINPLIKVFSFILLIVIISIASKIHSQLIASVFILIYSLISGISFKNIYRKILFLSIVFGLLIFLPASLNVVTPGNIIIRIFTIDKPYHFWIYTIPQTVGITDTGVLVVCLLFLRVFNSISLAMVFVYSTSFPKIIKGFKVFFLPDTILMVLNLTYKYIFILSKTIEETYFAIKSRLFGNVKDDSIRKIISGRIFFMFNKSKINYENTFHAMVSRGYNGKIKLCKEKEITKIDIYYLITILIAGSLIIFI